MLPKSSGTFQKCREPLLITQDGEAKLVVMDIKSYEEQEQTLALLRMLALGNKEVEQGKFRDAEDVFAELDKRIAEDDSRPHDTFDWEAIKKEAQARWQQ
ncbi:MAG: hypothetical protein WC825_03925 [Gallionellaceae bacterium]|jgi:PHD/YefM family antitoxin component YafN of YafNO toxin-antitoxin module